MVEQRKMSEPSNPSSPENKVTNREFSPEFEERKFKPGESGNPGGRPKKKWLTEVIEEMLEEKLSNPEFRAAYKEQAWKTLNSGKVVGAMMHEKVWDRTEGKLTTPVDVSGSIDIGEIIEKFRNK